MMKNRAVGFYLTLIACVLAVAGLVVYTRVMYTMTSVYVALAAVIVVEVLAFVLNNKILNEVLPIVGAVLLGFAAAQSAYVMVNQIGYVVAALDTIDTLYSYIAFVVLAALGMLLDLVAGFLRQTKAAA